MHVVAASILRLRMALFACPECSEQRTTLAAFVQHMAQAHEVVVQEDDDMPNVVDSAVPSTTTPDADGNAGATGEVDDAVIAPSSFRDYKTPEGRMANRGGTLKCPHCDVSRMTDKQLRHHVASVHAFCLPFSCKVCKRGFANKDILDGHNRTKTHKKRHESRKRWSKRAPISIIDASLACAAKLRKEQAAAALQVDDADDSE